MLMRTVRFACAGVCLLFCGAGTASPLEPTLKIGDAAPLLQAMRWIKGAPVLKFEPGRVYVVEFWATWCVPCKEIMPHLSELQKKYPDRLTVVGVDVRETEKGQATESAVRKFVAGQAEKMAYTVAMDDPVKKTIFAAWMTAAGIYGIPASFVVDGKGRVVWIDNPVGTGREALDMAVEQALAGKSDLAAARKVQQKVNRETALRLGK